MWTSLHAGAKRVFPYPKEALPSREDDIHCKKLGEISSGSVGDHKGTVVRVKVKMTKQEAARLLSRCREGGRLEFRAVACELARVPTDRITVVVPPRVSSHGSVLATIPEEI